MPDATALLGMLAESLVSGRVEVVDCSGVLGPDTPLLRLPPEMGVDTPKVEIHPISRYDARGRSWSWNWLMLGEHSGTHFDAPKHWITGRDNPRGATDTLDLRRVVAPVNVIDCSAEAAENPDFLLEVHHIAAWEARHGAINPGEWVVMRTDWDRYAGDAARYLNADEAGPHTPGPSAAAIRHLIGKGIVGWGTQCVGTDAGLAGGMDPPFPAHSLLHAHDRFGLASLTNLSKLPARGAILIAAPLRIAGGTGSPVRALALVARE